jgi:chemotaxis protein MotB
MRKLTLAGLAVICVAMISCVSKSKFTDLENEKAQVEQQLQETETMVTDLKDQNSQLQSQNEQLQSRVNTLEADLSSSNSQISEIRAQVDQMSTQLNRITGEIDDAFSGVDELGMEVQAKGDQLYISISNAILFRPGSATISDEGANVLDELSEAFKEKDEVDIVVEGHTDADPVRITRARWKDNWGLSVARAVSVVRALVERGVDASQLTAAGRGEHMPAASDDKSLNRRTEFIVKPKVTGLYNLSQGMNN